MLGPIPTLLIATTGLGSEGSALEGMRWFVSPEMSLSRAETKGEEGGGGAGGKKGNDKK